MTLNEIEDRLYAIMSHAYGADSSIRHDLLYKALAQFHQEVWAANLAAADRAIQEEVTEWIAQRQQT